MVRCRLCLKELGAFRAFKDAKSGKKLEIAFCEHCGFVQQKNIPTSDELKIYYSHTYRQDYKKSYQPKIKHVYRAAKAAIDRLEILLRHIKNPSQLSLLDIGAGGGEFVYLAGRTGFSASGVEPNLGYSEYARDQYGVQVSSTTLDELPEQSSDVVTLFHVLEHLAKPEETMKRIYQTLNSNGLLFIEVPNILQNDASPHNIYFKAHLFYYSLDTLRAVTSKYFEVVEVCDQGNLRAIFRKRKIPLHETQLPDEASVDKAKRRLREKGWMEYLFDGGGIYKPFKRIRQLFIEKNLRYPTPRTVLDAMPNPKRLR